MTYVTIVGNRGIWLDITRRCYAFVTGSLVTEYGTAHTSLSLATGVDRKGILPDFVLVRETISEARLR